MIFWSRGQFSWYFYPRVNIPWGQNTIWHRSFPWILWDAQVGTRPPAYLFRYLLYHIVFRPWVHFFSLYFEPPHGKLNCSFLSWFFCSPSRDFKVFYNRRYFLNFRRYLNQSLPGACNRSPGSKLLSITTQLHCGGYLARRAQLPNTILQEDHPMTIPSKFGFNWATGSRQDGLYVNFP
jgi:hypothetical protein